MTISNLNLLQEDVYFGTVVNISVKRPTDMLPVKLAPRLT